MFNSRGVRGISVALAILLTAPPGWSWGHDGHRLVAKIAAKNLSPDTRKKVAAILGTNDAGVDAAMAHAATWPDEIDKQTTGTGAWHRIHVAGWEALSVPRACPQHHVAVDRLQEGSDRPRTYQPGFPRP